MGALTAARSLRDINKECALALEVGKCEFNIPHRINKAREWFEMALKLCGLPNFQKEILLKARVLTCLANLEMRTGHFDKAQSYYQQATAVAAPFPHIRSLCLQGQAVMAIILEDWQTAIEHLEAASRESATSNRSSLHYNLGYCYTQIGAFDKARVELQQALTLSSAAKDRMLRALTQFVLGLGYEMERQLDQAIFYYQEICSTQPTAEALIGLARIYATFKNKEMQAQILAEQGQRLLENEPFNLLIDYTLEWTTLLQLRQAKALSGVNRWLVDVLRCLPPNLNYWDSLPRRNLLRTVKNISADEISSSSPMGVLGM